MNSQRLLELYSNTSKHSHYQLLPSSLRSLIGADQLQVDSRWEQERLDFVNHRVPVEGKTVGDIGGNTGFFSFELIDQGAKHVYYYEGNQDHANFVREAAAQLGLSDRIHVSNEYFLFDRDLADGSFHVDVLLLLNVLHHVGDDYGQRDMSLQHARDNITSSLRQIGNCAKQLVFQLGFNWQGNRNLPLFEQGTKQELVEFVRSSVAGIWNVDHIGVPVRCGEDVVYAALDSTNIARDDSLGEFLNRPLFILSRVQNC